MSNGGRGADLRALGEKVKTARLQRNLTPKDLARELEISTSHVYSIEGGRTNVSTSLRKRLDDFVADTPNTPPAGGEDLLPLIRLIAEAKLDRLSGSEFDKIRDAQKRCTELGITFSAGIVEEVLAHLRK